MGNDSPGPSAYSVPSAIGKQTLSTRKSAGGFKMPTGPRFVDPLMREAAAKPAPGSYSPTRPGTKVSSGLGCLMGRMCCMMPKWYQHAMQAGVTFGSGSREEAQHIFISTEHEKGQVGIDSPGPKYSPQDALSHLSTKPSSPIAKFGTSARLGVPVDQTPGPGAYNA